MNRTFVGQVPDRIKRLPVDHRGYPVPKFVAWKNGEPVFPAADYRHMLTCIGKNVCWICGEPMGVHKVFVVGPMCCVNRVSAEPPSHRECAHFAALNCPFLAQPLAKRAKEEKLKVPVHQPGGIMIERNPGVTCLWTTRRYEISKARGGTIFYMGDPDRMEFFAHGRKAEHDEIEKSVRTGLPILEKMAKLDGPKGIAALDAQVKKFHALYERLVA